MNITVFGAGYVGLVTAACLSDIGHQVVCVDVDAHKISALNAGDIPIYEPGLSELVARSVEQKSLQFTTSANTALEIADVVFIAVGTPSLPNGEADLSYVFSVADTLAEHAPTNPFPLIVCKSTVPVGTTFAIRKRINQQHKTAQLEVVFNPEFLREGAALGDFMQPDRVVIGAESEHAFNIMQQIYQPILKDAPQKFITMDVLSAELTKYASNAMLATKISFINEMANIAERLGADIEQVKQGIGSDKRIGPYFINPGCGYGGSCFPKDVKALIQTAEQVDYEPKILQAVEAVNQKQKHRLTEKLTHHFASLAGLRVAIWGLAFKPETDDMREAPSVVLIHDLIARGASLALHDPIAMAEAKKILPHQDNIQFCETKEAAIEGADVLVIVTEWQAYKTADLNHIHSVLKQPVIIDGRNLFDPVVMADKGFVYDSIGRSTLND